MASKKKFEPQVVRRWHNYYADSSFGMAHNTRREANKASSGGRIAVLRVSRVGDEITEVVVEKAK